MLDAHPTLVMIVAGMMGTSRRPVVGESRRQGFLVTVGSGRSADPRWAFFSIAPDLDWVELRDGSVLFRGDGLSVRVDGASVREFVGSILPLLRTPKDISELASALPQYDPAGLLAALDRFSQLGLLRRHTQHDSDSTAADSSAPWFAFLELRSGVAEGSTARKSLAALSIGIVGRSKRTARTSCPGAGALRGRYPASDRPPIRVGPNTSAGRPH